MLYGVMDIKKKFVERVERFRGLVNSTAEVVSRSHFNIRDGGFPIKNEEEKFVLMWSLFVDAPGSCFFGSRPR